MLKLCNVISWNILISAVKTIVANPREIKYTDKWNSERFHHNDVHEPEYFDEDFGRIPLPYLRGELTTNDFADARPKKQRQNRPQNFSEVFKFLFGGGRATTTSTTTTTTEPTTTTGDPATQTLSNRTRRVTKYKIKGNCKNPPKKHDHSDVEDDE